MIDNVVTIQEAADLLGNSVQHVRLLARKGQLEATKVGRDWLINRDAVADLKARRATLPLITLVKRGRPPVMVSESSERYRILEDADLTAQVIQSPLQRTNAQQIANIDAQPKTDSASEPIPGFERINSLSYGEFNAANFIIHGENLAVLNSLLPRYEGSVRCVYIDPPYNNQEKYTHYTDDLSHDEWLINIKSRIVVLRKLLNDNGSLWVSIDDHEVHYLKVAIDDVFGRENFLTTIVWQQRATRENRKVFSNNHEYLLVYAKDARRFETTRNLLPAPLEIERRYRNPDNDPRGPWQSVSLNAQAGHATPSQFYDLVAPNGRRHAPPKGRCWVYNQERMQQEISSNNVWFGQDGNGVPRRKRFLSGCRRGVTPDTLWTADQAGTNDTAKKHLLKLFAEYPLFDTPKPEQLIRRVIQIATNPGDTVLDAYLGSGTTTAVAHKMGRHYLGIEEGEHIVSHCVTRMRQVVDGERGGVSCEVGWNGGGGFSFLSWVGGVRQGSL